MLGPLYSLFLSTPDEDLLVSPLPEGSGFWQVIAWSLSAFNQFCLLLAAIVQVFPGNRKRIKLQTQGPEEHEGGDKEGTLFLSCLNRVEGASLMEACFETHEEGTGKGQNSCFCLGLRYNFWG